MLRLSLAGAVLVLGLTLWIVMGDRLLTQIASSLDKAPAGTSRSERAPPSSGDKGIAVEAAAAESAHATADLRAIGSLQSEESVQIASEIAGRVTEIPFEEGGPVAAGDLLVKLDDALVAAEVADTEARYKFATEDLGRANTLARSGNVTERARDQATTNAETSRAALELAKVRLSKHVIRAPFAGVVGIRKVSPGAYVAVGQPIVNLEKIDTLKIEFKLPEQFLSQIAVGQQVEIEVDALPGRSFPGTIYAIDPHIDVNGRALSIRARLPNAELTLRPGLFARILVKGPTRRNVLVVPESAIVPRGSDKIVFSIENGQAIETKVTLGARRDGRVEILDGLKAEALVVTAGQQKLRNGVTVEVVASGAERGSGS